MGTVAVRRRYSQNGTTGLCDEPAFTATQTDDSEAQVIDWDEIRQQFNLVPHRVNLSGMSMASHPRPVREAIARHRRLLDSDPYLYLLILHNAEDLVCAAASE